MIPSKVSRKRLEKMFGSPVVAYREVKDGSVDFPGLGFIEVTLWWSGVAGGCWITDTAIAEFRTATNPKRVEVGLLGDYSSGGLTVIADGVSFKKSRGKR